MRIEITSKLAAALLLLAMAAAMPATEPMTWYVSPKGNDAWTGQRAKPAGADGPMATLAAALAASRKHAGKARRIQLAPGRYYVSEPIVLEAKDAGLAIEGAGQGKTIIYGGQRVAGWRRDGDRFWATDAPEVKTGKWDFRALVVNDRLCPRARLPETGRFTHESHFPVRWMSTAGGGWERKPTLKERTTMQYRAGDLGPWLSVRNAEVTVYHMWDESMVGVKAIDPATRTLTFSTPCGHPPGAFGKRTYVVWNVREGMKKPGQWYLDRDAGRIVYWPLPDEDMSKALAVAPRVETILGVRGQKGKPVRNVTLTSLTLSTTTTPCKAGGFGASRYRGALQIAWGEGIHVADVEITNTAGHAIREWASRGLRIERCRLHHLGAGGLRAGGGTGRFEGNRIHHVGMLYPSAIGLSAGGRNSTYVIRRNVIHDTPYSGMTPGGAGTLVEENVLYRCMQVLHDGAAIYSGGAQGLIMRRNVVRDIAPAGKGYGVSAYYLDEKCRGCIVEKNVSIGVERPSQNHMTLNCVIRDNVFINAGGMSLGTSRCAGLKFIGNTFQLDGALKISDPDAVTEWSGNLLVQTGDVAPAISDAMPRPKHTPRNKPKYARVVAMAKPPVLDGKLDGAEWPPGGSSLSEQPDQRRARGAPIMAKFGADKTHLYVGLSIVSMFPEDRKLGHTWGADEGVEIAVQGQLADGKPVTYVLRGFADGTLDSLAIAGAPQADAFGKTVGYAARVGKKVWQSEWRIPFAALRFTPSDRAVLPLNVTAYRSENKGFIQFAGTLGETWDLERGGRLIFRGPRSAAKPRPKPVAQAVRVATAPALDGRASEGEWPGKALVLRQTPSGVPISGKPCTARVATDGANLFVHMAIPTARITRGREWRKDDGAEICIRGKTPRGKSVVWVVRGFAGGTYRSSTEAGAPKAASQALGKSVRFRASISKAGWQGEWAIPLKALGVSPAADAKVPFNLGIFRSESGEWINWIGTQGPTWKLERAGVLCCTSAHGHPRP